MVSIALGRPNRRAVPPRGGRSAISGREVAFFGLQTLIPTAFALTPAGILYIALRDEAKAYESLASGVLVLVAFTMLISLSQDLQQTVRPFQQRYVATLESLLRIFAIIILAVYGLTQAVAIVVNSTNVTGGSVPADRLRLDRWLVYESWWCLFLACVLAGRILTVLRPHFVDAD